MDKALFTDDHAERLKARAGQKYRPSNGTEGDMFMGRWCAHCKRDEAFRKDEGDSCPIIAASFCYHLSDPQYPAEWQYGADGQPRCAAFEQKS